MEVNEFSSDLVFDICYWSTFKKFIKIVADKILKNVFPNKVQVQLQVKQRSKSTGLLPHHSINQIECLWVNWICLINFDAISNWFIPSKASNYKMYSCFFYASQRVFLESNLYFLLQVKVWFQNRRMKWKRTKSTTPKNLAINSLWWCKM